MFLTIKLPNRKQLDMKIENDVRYIWISSKQKWSILNKVSKGMLGSEAYSQIMSVLSNVPLSTRKCLAIYDVVTEEYKYVWIKKGKIIIGSPCGRNSISGSTWDDLLVVNELIRHPQLMDEQKGGYEGAKRYHAKRVGAELEYVYKVTHERVTSNNSSPSINRYFMDIENIVLNGSNASMSDKHIALLHIDVLREMSRTPNGYKEAKEILDADNIVEKMADPKVTKVCNDILNGNKNGVHKTETKPSLAKHGDKSLTDILYTMAETAPAIASLLATINGISDYKLEIIIDKLIVPTFKWIVDNTFGASQSKPSIFGVLGGLFMLGGMLTTVATATEIAGLTILGVVAGIIVGMGIQFLMQLINNFVNSQSCDVK